jgi:hypothetical protein
VEGRVVGVARRGGTANFLSVNDAEKKKKEKKTHPFFFLSHFHT